MSVRVTPRDYSLLLDLKDQGAALVEDLLRWFPSSSSLRMRLLRLVRDGYVEVVGYYDGQRIFGLGPRGKRHLGIRSNWRTRPQEALRQVLWRRCHAELTAEGYQRAGPWHGGLVLYRKALTTALAVQVLLTRPSVRYVRQLTKENCPGLIREGAVLCLFSPSTLPLRELDTRPSLTSWLRSLPKDLGRSCE